MNENENKENNNQVVCLSQENERLIAELSESKRKNLAYDNERYIDSLLNEGKIFPSQKDTALELLNYAGGYDNGGIVKFSEGENLQTKLKDFFDKLNPLQLTQQTEQMAIAELSSVDYESYRTKERLDIYKKNPFQLNKAIQQHMKMYNVDYKTAFNFIVYGENK
ncbi:hypothetical protein [Lonepinella sp. MS14435]|uniref:hypothetical protein n=1 Tax=Lonepinella sp. MS14435 TaxID=3003618 RepID=UPI0036DA0589